MYALRTVRRGRRRAAAATRAQTPPRGLACAARKSAAAAADCSAMSAIAASIIQHWPADNNDAAACKATMSGDRDQTSRPQTRDQSGTRGTKSYQRNPTPLAQLTIPPLGLRGQAGAKRVASGRSSTRSTRAASVFGPGRISGRRRRRRHRRVSLCAALPRAPECDAHDDCRRRSRPARLWRRRLRVRVCVGGAERRRGGRARGARRAVVAVGPLSRRGARARR